MPKFIDKERKRLHIMNAALRVFAQNGIGQSRIAEIALAAGVGKGTIYEYFRNKEDIFLAAFDIILQNIIKI